ncbi:MAG: hypothetical protein ABFD64_01970 [Armatimonadota bacterium]
MIGKVVENWLTNTTEREYQLPFCQILSLKGHRVVHVSSHGQGEHGKDVVSYDPKGHLCAFQTKTDNIGVREWQNINGEINDLTKLKVSLSNVPTQKGWHKSYLVTNGRITSDVKNKIQIYNQSYKGNASYLKTIEYDELFGDFVQVSDKLIPTEIPDFSRFLSLLLADGKDILPNHDISKFLISILPLRTITKEPKKDFCRRSIANSLIMTNFIGQHYLVEKNHFALVDLWIMLCAHILAVAERFRLDDSQ